MIQNHLPRAANASDAQQHTVSTADVGIACSWTCTRDENQRACLQEVLRGWTVILLPFFLLFFFFLSADGKLMHDVKPQSEFFPPFEFR